LAQQFNDEPRRREMADFLRSRRERLTPASAGLPSGRRRLTPGLRREEVAELAGVGTSWYTWLEQARDIRPSERTIRNVARALQLGKVDKEYFFDLALERAPRIDREEEVTPLLLSIVNGISSPACVLGRRGELIAYNVAANALKDLDYIPVRNMLRNMFVSRCRAFHAHWAQFARQMVGLFRAQNAGTLGHPAVAELVDELAQQSQQFREWWAEQAVSEMNSGHVTYDHPFVGRLYFDFELLRVIESPGLTLEIEVCDGVETHRRLDELIRQLRNGQHSPTHNLWTALESQPLFAAP
jgi:transcriptional regulator with XRE-family HTH domain